MFLSRRMSCPLKYAGGQSSYCQLKSYRCLKTFVNKKSQVERKSIFYKHHISQISTLPILAKEHTIKGWKFKARDGEIPAKLPHDACEEGKEAVPHSVLVSELQKCSSVSSQIETFCSLLSLTSEDIENRRAFCQSLEEALSIYFPHFRITQFGSSINGLGFKGCDADVCLQTFNNEDYVILKEVPSLNSVHDGTVSRETLSRMTPKYKLHFVSRILREHCPDVSKNILYINARCPILRFYNAKYDVFCDFSCESKNSVRNTMLLRLLCSLDDRFATVAKIIRYWGKYGGFVGDIDTFNSYAFSLLVVHFLQTRCPPVLPPIQEIIKESEYLQNGNVEDTDLLMKDLKKNSSSQNTKFSEELLREFYFYFLTFDFSRVMLLYSSSSISKSNFKPERTSDDNFEFGAVNIQDPFRHTFNVSGGALYKSCKEFMYSILKTCQSYQNDSLWTPNTENWGLCSLFHEPYNSSHQRTLNEWNEKRSYTMHLPSIPDGAKTLKSIFEYGLLFHCNEFRISDSDNKQAGSQLLLKLHCKAFYRTWQGRDFVKNSESSNNCVLKQEHLISKELVNKNDSKRQVLCEFHCECSEVRNESESRLVLRLDFMESKFPPLVAMFLIEFIPHVFRKL